MIEELVKDVNEIKELLDENGKYKQEASLYEIAKCWTQNSPHEFSEIARNLFVRCRDGNFSFKYPKELYINNDQELIFCSMQRISSSDLNSISVCLINSVENLCKNAVRNNKAISDIDYDDIFQCFYDKNIEFEHWSIYSFVIKLATIAASKIYTPPTPKERQLIDYTIENDVNNYLSDESITKRAVFDEKLDSILPPEKLSMIVALTKHISIERETFLHWLRLGLNTEKGSINFHKMQSFLPLQYNGFWGDEWEGHPKVWNCDVSDSEGLILRDAYKYYSDSDSFAEYEKIVEQISKLKSEYKTKTNAEQIEKDLRRNKERLEVVIKNLQSSFLSHFHPNNNRLFATGYFDQKTPETITHAQLIDMFEGDQINIDSSCGTIGQVNVTSVRIFKKGISADGFKDWKEEYLKLKNKYENSYSTIYLDAMRDAILHYNITEYSQPMKDDLVGWFKNKIPDLSDNLAKGMATMVRRPEMQRGGYYRGNKKKGETLKHQ